MLALLIQLFRLIDFPTHIRGRLWFAVLQTIELHQFISIFLVRADDNPRLREEVPLLEESRRLVVILIFCRNEITILESQL